LNLRPGSAAKAKRTQGATFRDRRLYWAELGEVIGFKDLMDGEVKGSEGLKVVRHGALARP
jgi:hypothetical protein